MEHLATETQGRTLKILVVDDDQASSTLMRRVLEKGGYVVNTVSDGREALKTFYTWQPALVILDIMMPKMDGWTVLERIREVSTVPVIMLTALGQEHQKVRGLQEGADDYLVKPIGIPELLARVEAVLRRLRAPPQIADVYADGALHVDFKTHRVLVNGHELELSPMEFRLLSALVRNRNIIMSPSRLLELCWGDRQGGPESVRVYIGYLRRKLNAVAHRGGLIETVREFGYRYRSPQPDTSDSPTVANRRRPGS